MTENKKKQDAKHIKRLTETKLADRLFLDTPYNISRYPHPQTPRRCMRQNLFMYEEKHVFRASKAKK